MTTDNAGTHSHSTTALDAEIAALKARVTALETPAPPPVEPPPPTTGKVVKVTSVAALLATLADDTVDEIVVANGTYRIPGASSSTGKTSGLRIDERFAGRTRAVLVRAETTGQVTFDGGGSTYWMALQFVSGAHDQTWQGFRFANGEPTGTGIVVFGGFSGLPPTRNITLRDVTIGDLSGSVNKGHAVYISHAYGGPHRGLLFDRLVIKDAGGRIDGGIHFFHDSYESATAPKGYFNAEQTTIRNCSISGVRVGFYVWARTVNGLVVEECTVTNASEYGVRYELGENITFRRVSTSGSRYGGFSPTYYMAGGPYRYPSIPELGPDGVPGPKLITFESCDFQ